MTLAASAINAAGQVDPLSVYSKSKLAGEQNISTVGRDVSYSAYPLGVSMGSDSFVTKVLEWARKILELDPK